MEVGVSERAGELNEDCKEAKLVTDILLHLTLPDRDDKPSRKVRNDSNKLLWSKQVKINKKS